MNQKSELHGRILRVKTGYNPNSSSVGSHVPVFLAFATGSGALTVIILQILNKVKKHIHNQKHTLNSDSET